MQTIVMINSVTYYIGQEPILNTGWGIFTVREMQDASASVYTILMSISNGRWSMIMHLSEQYRMCVGLYELSCQEIMLT